MYARSQGDLCDGAPLERQETIPAAGIFVKRLTVTNFRNYPYVRLDLPEKVPFVVLTGKNGSGKTNLMEAVSFLAPGKGLRHARFSEVARHTDEKNMAWAVAASLVKGNEEIDIGTGCEAPEAVKAKTAEKRTVRLNGEPHKSQAVLGNVCAAVWLTPSMDRLFSGDPAGRRRFWDRLTQAFYTDHASNCAIYAQSLRQWGYLLREGKADDAWLSALEETLGKYGAKTAFARRETLLKLVEELETAHGSFPRALLSFDGGMEEELSTMNSAEATVRIREQFRLGRAQYLEKGTAGSIHTVDLRAIHREKGMQAALCSTGEQKALLVSVLLAHVRAQARQMRTLPLLLLDEVTAHLDKGRKKALFEELETLPTQIWMTGTDSSLFEGTKETAHFVAVEKLSRTSPLLAAS